MSKARCVDNKDCVTLLIVGKAYDVLDRGTDVFYLIDEFGDVDKYSKSRFQLLPDEPKAEWMRVDLDAYVNMKTGITVQFFKDTDGRSAWVSSLFAETVKYHATGSLADAFAALVGYEWKEG